MKKTITIFFIFSTCFVLAQNDRISDFNNINWVQTINTITVNKKWSLRLEYQWRRKDVYSLQ